MKLTDHSGQAHIEAVPSAPALIIKALKQRPRNGKKKKKIKHNGNTTFEETDNIAQQMWPRSFARELCGAIKEILGSAQSVGCYVDGCHTRDDINSGAGNAQLGKNYKGTYFN